MDPMTAVLLGGALGGRGSTTRQTTTTSQAMAVNTPVGVNISTAFNPVLAALSGQGAGVAPSTSGSASGGLSMNPTTTANPTTSVVDPSSGGGSSIPGFLPRTSPTGYGVGPGFGYIAPRTVPRGFQGDDLLLLMLIGGAVLWFASQD